VVDVFVSVMAFVQRQDLWLGVPLRLRTRKSSTGGIFFNAVQLLTRIIAGFCVTFSEFNAEVFWSCNGN
jgi:hypothetical protein